MANALRELVVSLGFEFDKQGLAQIDKGLTDLKERLKQIAIFSTAVAGTFFGFVQSTTSAVNEVRKLSSELSIGTRDLQSLTYVAKINGATTEDMTSGLQSLIGAMNSARLGQGTQALAFRRLGITIKDTNGVLLPVTEVMKQLADRMKALPDSTMKTAIATDVLGGSAGALMETLNQGSDGFMNARKSLEAMGGIFSDSQIAQSKAYARSMQEFLQSLVLLRNQIGFALLPIVKRLVDAFSSLLRGNQKFIKSGFVSFLKILGEGLKSLFYVARGFASSLNYISVAADSILKPFGGLVTVLKYVAAAMGLIFAGQVLQNIFLIGKGLLFVNGVVRKINLSALTIPILIGAVAAALYLIIDDVVAYFQGRPSVLGYLIRNREKLLKDIQSWIAKVKQNVLKFIEIVTKKFFILFGVTEEQATKVAAKIKSFFEYIFSSIENGIAFAINVATVGLKFLVNLIADLISKPLQTIESIGPRVGKLFKDLATIALGALGNSVLDISKLFGLDTKKIKEYWDSFSKFAMPVIERLAQAFSNIFDGIKNVFMFVIESITTIVRGLVQTVSALLTPLDSLRSGAKSSQTFMESLTPNFLKDLKANLARPAGAPRIDSTTINNTINLANPVNGSPQDLSRMIAEETDARIRQQMRKARSLFEPNVSY